jgi:hypothetical protein
VLAQRLVNHGMKQNQEIKLSNLASRAHVRARALYQTELTQVYTGSIVPLG